MTGWIDTHCHLDAPEFAADVAAVRARARERGVVHCVLPAVQVTHFAEVHRLAHAFGDSYALGIHPLYVKQAQDEDLARLDAALAEHRDDPQLVAVGEIGLDYFVPELDGPKQEHFFHVQLQLARAHDLPVIIHVRRSVDQVLKHLRQVGAGRPWRGIAHAFNGSEQQAKACLDLGLKLGFGGTVTFDRALQVRRLATSLPLDAIVMETDAPDIQPHWLYRTQQERQAGAVQGRNEPAELPRIAAVLAQLRGMTTEELARASTRNALDALPRLSPLLMPSGGSQACV